MEYKSVSTKMPMNEVTQFKAFCENKGVSPASLIRELILRELGVPVPSTVAGRNIIAYEKEGDRFTWSVGLDSGEVVEVLGNVAPQFMEELGGMIARGLDERDSFMGRALDDSVPVPSGIVRGQG